MWEAGQRRGAGLPGPRMSVSRIARTTSDTCKNCSLSNSRPSQPAAQESPHVDGVPAVADNPAERTRWRNGTCSTSRIPLLLAWWRSPGTERTAGSVPPEHGSGREGTHDTLDD